MSDSWIALVNQNGLSKLVVEDDHVRKFMLRRAQRENCECFWVVLSRTHAQIINYILWAESSTVALQCLEHFAIDLGRIPRNEVRQSWFVDDVTIPDGRDKEYI